MNAVKPMSGNRQRGFAKLMSLDFAEFISTLSNWTLVVASLVAVLSTFGVYISGNVKEMALKRDLAEANTTAEVAKADAAKANENAATLNERAAKLEETAAKLRADNLILEKQIAPRRLNQEQSEQLSNVLGAHQDKTIVLSSYAMDVESALLGEQFIRAANWANTPLEDNRMSISSLGNIVSGISVTGTDLEFIDEIIKTLNTFDLIATNINPPVPTGMIISIGDPNEQPDVKIFIGPKPLQ